MRVLLAAHPTAAHTNALRAIGLRLLSQGHEVGIAIVTMKLPFAERWPEPVKVAMTLPQSLAKDGIKIFPLRFPLPSLWYGAQLPKAKAYAELRLALKLFTGGITGQARQIAAYADTWKADVIVGDYLMPAALLGATLARRPYAALYHSALPFPMEGAPPFGSHLVDIAADASALRHAQASLAQLGDYFDRRVASAAKSLGLPFRRRSLLTSPISEHLNLLATSNEIEPGLLPLQGPVVMTGPCLLPTRDVERDDPALTLPKDGKKRVYVSLGTVFNGQPHVFEAILDGIGGEGFQTLVSAGASYDHLSKRTDPDLHIFRRVPQVALLPTTDVVITHGGNNTVQETLIAGKPMIAIPFGGDQIANAQRIERLGAGVAVMPEVLSAATLRKALRVATNADVVARAQALGVELRKVDGTGVATEAILALVTSPPRQD